MLLPSFCELTRWGMGMGMARGGTGRMGVAWVCGSGVVYPSPDKPGFSPPFFFLPIRKKRKEEEEKKEKREGRGLVWPGLVWSGLSAVEHIALKSWRRREGWS